MQRAVHFTLVAGLACALPMPSHAQKKGVKPVDGEMAFEYVRTMVAKREGGRKHAPHGMSVDSNGNMFVADYYNPFVDKFDASGNYVKSIQVKGKCRNCTVDKDGNLYVTAGTRIMKFDNDGRELTKWEVGGGNFNSVHYGRYSGNLYVYTSGLARYDLNGKKLKGTFNTGGIAAFYISEDANKNVYVVGWRSREGGGAIAKISPEGKLLKKWTFDDKDLKKPEAIDVDRAGNMYIADTYNHRVVVLSPAGNRIAVFGTKGQGETGLGWPQGIWVNPEGTMVYVADSNNGKTKLWRKKGTGVEPKSE